LHAKIDEGDFCFSTGTTAAAAATATVARPCSFDCRSWPGIDLDKSRHYFFNVAHFLMGLKVS
jgi:hypothetical protein